MVYPKYVIRHIEFERPVRKSCVGTDPVRITKVSKFHISYKGTLSKESQTYRAHLLSENKKISTLDELYHGCTPQAQRVSASLS